MDMPPATPTLGSLLKRIDALEIENVALKAALERLKGENEAFKGENVVLKAKVELLIHHRLRKAPGLGRQELVEAGERLRQAMLDAPAEAQAQNLAKRFRDNGDAYLRFTTRPDVEPTNNNGEQSIRHGVIDRASSQGTRGQAGREYKEQAWSAIATCAQCGVSAFNYLLNALRKHANPAAAPP